MPLTYPELGDSDAGFDLRKIHQLQVIVQVGVGQGQTGQWRCRIAPALHLDMPERGLVTQLFQPPMQPTRLFPLLELEAAQAPP